MNNISKHITYKEATVSQTSVRYGIKNDPNEKQLAAMRLVAEKCFEPMREHFGVPIRVNSFFRCEELNRKIGGAKNSQHMQGEAIDLDAIPGTGITNADLFNWLKDNVEFDQLLWEYGDDNQPDWVHVSYNSDGKNRKQVLRIR